MSHLALWSELLSQKVVNLGPRVACQFRIDAIEMVAARRTLINPVFELPSGCLQRRYQALNFDDVHSLVVGVPVNEQRFFELRGPSDRRSAAVFLIVLRGRFTRTLGDRPRHRL